MSVSIGETSPHFLTPLENDSRFTELAPDDWSHALRHGTKKDIWSFGPLSLLFALKSRKMTPNLTDEGTQTYIHISHVFSTKEACSRAMIFAHTCKNSMGF